MKRLFALALLAAAAETAALACSCLATDDPEELRRIAAHVAENATALVEAEALTSYERTRAGEQMRVVRVFAGDAPASFQVYRGRGVPSSASCDMLYRPGERATVILYPAPAAGAATLPVYRTSGLCTVHMLEQPAFREEVGARLAGQRGGERG